MGTHVPQTGIIHAQFRHTWKSRSYEILSRTDNGLDYLLKYAESLGYSLQLRGKEYRSKGNGKIRIRKNKGRWVLTDFSGEIPGGDIFRIAAHVHGISSIKGKGFKDVVNALCKELNIVPGQVIPGPTRPARKLCPEPEPWRPNQGYKPKVSSTYKISNEKCTRNKVFGKWGISPDTLDTYEVHELASVTSRRGYTRYSTESAPLFLFKAAGNEKVYCPFPVFGQKGNKRKTNYLQSTGNYVFGYDQLPAKCKGIIIAAGQKDTLSLNSLLNSHGIYAICLNSEGASLPSELVNDLEARADCIYVLYDNDKTGYRESKKICEQYTQIKRLFVPDAQINDVCDYVEANGGGKLAWEVLAQMYLLADPFHYPIKTKKHQIKGFIGNNPDVCRAVEKFIFERKKIQLVAPTGSGKTTFVFEHLRGLMATNEHKFIFAVPTQALADQISNKYNVPCVREGSDRYDMRAAEHSNTIVCTYDSMHKIKSLIPGSTVFFDESHHLVMDANRGYKFNQVNRAFELAEQASRVVQISATPIPYMQRLGYEFITLEQEETQALNIITVECEKEPIKYLLSNLIAGKESGKIQIVFWDDKKQLAVIARQLERAGKATKEEIAIMHADNKSENLVYNSIIKNGVIPDGIKYILTTRLIADGVSIYNENIGIIHQVDVINEELFIQFSARFRNLDKRTVYSYRRTKAAALKAKQTAEAFRVLYACAEHELKRIEIYNPGACDGYSARYREDTRSMNACYQSEISSLWRVSDLAIFQQEIDRRDRQTTPEQFYKRIAAKYSYVSILDASTINIDINDELQAAVKADKRYLKDLERQAYRKLLHHPFVFLRAVYEDTGARETRERIAGIIDTETDCQAAAELIHENKELFELKAWKMPVRQFCRLYEIGFSEHAAVKILSDPANRNNRNFAHLESRLHVQLAFNDVTCLNNAKDIYRIEQLRKTRKNLEQYKGQRISSKKLHSVVESTIMQLGKNQGIKVAKELFNITASKDANGNRFYLIGERLTLSDIACKYGMNESELMTNARTGAIRQKMQMPENQAIGKTDIINNIQPVLP